MLNKQGLKLKPASAHKKLTPIYIKMISDGEINKSHSSDDSFQTISHSESFLLLTITHCVYEPIQFSVAKSNHSKTMAL